MNETVRDFTLKRLLGILLKRWWIIALAMVLCVGMAIVYTAFFVTPTYTTYTKMGANITEVNIYYAIQMEYSLSKDSAEIAMSNITLNKAAELLNSYDFPENGGRPYRTYSADVLAGMVSTSEIPDSRYFTLYVTSIYPEETKIVAEKMFEGFCYSISEAELLVKDGADGKMMHEPVVPTSPSSPNMMSNVMLAAVISFILSFTAVVLVSFTRDVIESKDWFVTTYGEKIPLLAVIPDSNLASSGKSSRYGYRKYGKNDYRSRYGY